jgi:predicted nucleic-acid-binding protein
MILLDANYILRFLLKDNIKMYEEARTCILNHNCEILSEVLAEVVFVLLKVYKVSAADIQQILSKFIQSKNIIMTDKSDMISALDIFECKNIDFVDVILCAKSKEYQIKTFDKKLLSFPRSHYC